MENASKALIIAASILVAILIVAMGVKIFNQAENSADTTSLDQTEINMFNSKFERYDNDQLGSQVKSLISFAISNASTNAEDPSELPTVQFAPEKVVEGNKPNYTCTATGGDTATSKISDYTDDLGKIRSQIVSTATYNIKLDYASTGLISTITITKK